MITLQDFGKVEIRVGLVVSAANKEGSDKLIRLKVRVSVSGEEIVVFTGVRTYGYTPDDFLNKKFLFVTNLEHKKMMDEESQGMILAVDGLEMPFGEHGEAKPLFVEVESLPVGSKVR